MAARDSLEEKLSERKNIFFLFILGCRKKKGRGVGEGGKKEKRKAQGRTGELA